MNEFDEEWIRKFKNKDVNWTNITKDKRVKFKSNKKSSSKKKYLEDKIQEIKSENDSSLNSNKKRGSKELRWKVPIDSVRPISEVEEERQGFLNKMFGYFCVYLPQKICPLDMNK